jgi:hypothetical protein
MHPRPRTWSLVAPRLGSVRRHPPTGRLTIPRPLAQ